MLWTALLALLVVAWRRQAADAEGGKIHVAPVAIVITFDALMIVAWLLVAAMLETALRAARLADQDDLGRG